VRERSAAGYIGWPPARLVARLRGQPPARKVLAGDPADAAQAQRSDIDNAVTVFAGEVGGSLPEPWTRTVLAVARSRADEAQAALGAAVAQGLPRRDKVTGWWRLIALAQWLLMTLMLAGLVWIVLILALGGSHSAHKPPSLINDVSLAPWLGVMVVALLLLGWLVSSWCRNMVVLAADRERQLAVHAILARVSLVASELVLGPVGREVVDYERFRTQLAAARGSASADLRPWRGSQVVGSVHAGAQVFAWGDARERPELTGEVRLVGVAVPGGRVRPVDVALPVQVPDEPLHPLHPREALRGEAHLRRESPPQGPRQHAEIVGYLPDRDAAGQRVSRGDHRPVERLGASQLLKQEILHHRKRTLGCARLDQPFPQACPRSPPEEVKRYQFVPGRRQRGPAEVASGTERECHRHVGVALLELDHRGAAGRAGQHGARNLADLASIIERPERVPVQVDPQAGFRAGQDLFDGRLRLLSGPVNDRSHQPAQRWSGLTDDDRHGLPVSLLAKTSAVVSWQDRSHPDKRWS